MPFFPSFRGESVRLCFFVAFPSAAHLTSQSPLWVYCAHTINYFHAEELRLERNFLSGQIPVRLGELIELEEFTFHSNDFTGRVPGTLCPLLEENGGELEELEADCDLLCACCTEECRP